ncbi:MAG: hypothetical protein MI742_13000 [Desulfobacterales bacterium]|nr:hypothetical protein [Desulfobacterales bacterium]
MPTHNCEVCPLRSRYNKKPTSLLGRLWRWHIGWCPGWKRYMNAQPHEKREAIKTRYNIKNQE